MAFEWISNEPISSIAYISLDSQDRLYLSVGAVKRLGITLPAPMMIGYDKVNKRLIIAKPELVRAVNTKPFKFGKDQYAHARAVVEHIEADGLTERPLRFVYVGKDFTDTDYPDGTHVFQLVGFDAPDGGIYETLGSRRFRRSGAVKGKAVKQQD
ncbi:MAG: hypothetical protein IRZ03_10735 [Acidobacterium ailaaui]|nr:hypothetical protein [Pseudacidobacterium ailaaui]